MPTPNEVLLDHALQEALLLERLKLTEARRLIGAWERDVLPDLLARIEAALERGPARPGTARGLRTTQQLRRMRDVIRAAVKEGILSQYNSTADRLETVAFRARDVEIDAFRRVLQDQAPSIFRDFDPPNNNRLRTLVRTSPIKFGTGQAKRLRSWFDDMGKRQVDAIEGNLRVGLAQGESIPRIMRRLRTNNPGGPRALSRRDASVIARTSATHVSAQTRDLTFRGFGDLVRKVQWLSTLDTRTTRICLGLHLTTYDVGSGERPPAHAQCRSTVIPLIRGVADPVIQTADDWLNGLAPATQNRVLGRGIAALWRDGTIATARDLIGSNLEPISLQRFLSFRAA